MIVTQGQLNTSALVVPDLYVQIVPPQVYLINGQPSNIVGVVGSAAWGPVNQPVIIGDMPGYITAFSAPVARTYDMGTQVATAIQQGANNFRCVRVTDGTDAAAASTGVATCITYAAKYTGSAGNKLTVQLVNGSKPSSWKAIIGVAGTGQPEQFDNIVGTGNAFWVALANAINSGTGALRGPSNLVVATSAAGTTAPAITTSVFTGGTDGTASLDATDVLGADTTPRTGIYALRSQGCAMLVPADLTDSTKWSTVDGLAIQESMYAILCGPSGDTIANAVSTKATAGLDSYATKLMFGDWAVWNDPFLQLQRLVSPQGFIAGRLANLSPEESSLNKPIYGVVGTQRSNSTSATYSNAELTQLIQSGIDLICNPGAGQVVMWTARVGHNSSSNAAVNGDNYTRLTNFIATSLNAGMGKYCGKVINDGLAKNCYGTLTSFLLNMYGQGLLGDDADGGGLPFSVICGFGPGTNNPPERTKLGNFQADISVQYQAINERFLVNLQGGQTVTVARQTSINGQVITVLQ